jgi:tetratricopeptide (TPR) repeat protein
MTYVKSTIIQNIALRSLLLGGVLLLSACQMLPGSSAKSTAAAAGPQEVTAAVQTQFDAAIAAQNAQQWPQAEQQYKQLLEKYPQLSGPALNLALIYAQTDRPQLAEEYFERALQINPNNVVAADQYGVWLRSQGRFDAAEKIYLQALSSHPDHADTHLNLAILYDLYLGKLPQALEHYQRYLELVNDEKSPVHGWVADLQRRIQSAG